MTRSVLLLAHTGRKKTADAARHLGLALLEAGVELRMVDSEAADLDLQGVVSCDAGCAAEGAELVLVLGGDGTILRAAELSRATGVPLLGINLGHVGFLAEVEPEDLDGTVQHVLAHDYVVEQRMTLDVRATHDGRVVAEGWALNEASLGKLSPDHMLEVVVEVDGRPLSRWGCDGVVAATPTGSTAYAFSAGGPVVWPEVEALLVVPISAHALFNRPMVVGVESVVAMEVLASGARPVLTCDGRRTHELPHGARIEVRRGSTPVPLARRVPPRTFTDVLVDKFALPVEGWRGRHE